MYPVIIDRCGLAVCGMLGLKWGVTPHPFDGKCADDARLVDNDKKNSVIGHTFPVPVLLSPSL